MLTDAYVALKRKQIVFRADVKGELASVLINDDGASLLLLFANGRFAFYQALGEWDGDGVGISLVSDLPDAYFSFRAGLLDKAEYDAEEAAEELEKEALDRREYERLKARFGNEASHD